MLRIATLAEVLESPPLLDRDGWLVHPDFLRIDGVPDKIYTQPNGGELGLAGHSIVGEEPDEWDGIPGRFLSLEKDAAGRYTKNAAASCMYILRKRSKHVVMYPTWASTWTSGGREANCGTWPSEAEGGRNPHNEPLTAHQEKGEIIIATAWEQAKRRRLTAADLNEHGQLAQRFGYAATSCASGRYRRVFDRILAGERWVPAQQQQEDDEMERWALMRLAGGPFRPMLEGYEKLSAKGYFAELDALEGKPAPIDGANDLNDAVVRRMRIQWLAGGPKAGEAASFLKLV